MENTEEIFQCLDNFSKRKPKIIPRELEEYLAYVARTGDPVYQWPVVKCLFKEKLLNVITDFYETSPGLDIPHCPNVDPFNYDTMKNSLLEKIDSFSSAPFTVQRICELLTAPRKQYNRIDKFMRAIEKNVLVVSTREPGVQRHVEQENGEQIEPMVNGSDNNSDYNVDVDMEDMSWKRGLKSRQNTQSQPGSSNIHISYLTIRLQAKEESEPKEISIKMYEAVTPPESESNLPDENMSQNKDDSTPIANELPITEKKEETLTTVSEKVPSKEEKVELENTSDMSISQPMNIPEIRIEDAEMTEQKLSEQASEEAVKQEQNNEQSLPENVEDVAMEDNVVKNPEELIESNTNIDQDVKNSDLSEPKHVPETVSMSSEESSSSSDNTDGNSNSPKTDNEIQDESNQSSTTDSEREEKTNENQSETTPSETVLNAENIVPNMSIQNDDYSITDVKFDLPQVLPEKTDEVQTEEKESIPIEVINKTNENPVEEQTEKVDNESSSEVNDNK